MSKRRSLNLDEKEIIERANKYGKEMVEKAEKYVTDEDKGS